MGHDKLRKFAENETFKCLLQPSSAELLKNGFFDIADHPVKGNWNRLMFGGNGNPIVLELGCGKGEYTIALAERNPGINYIGVDIKGARLWKGAKYATEHKMTNVAFLRTRIEFINAFFAPGEISQIWLTFSDPQLHSENSRLTSPLFLERYRKFLVPGGVVHLKTDSRFLHEYTSAVCRANGLSVLAGTTDLYSLLDCSGSDAVIGQALGIEDFALRAHPTTGCAGGPPAIRPRVVRSSCSEGPASSPYACAGVPVPPGQALPLRGSLPLEPRAASLPERDILSPAPPSDTVAAAEPERPDDLPGSRTKMANSCANGCKYGQNMMSGAQKSQIRALDCSEAPASAGVAELERPDDRLASLDPTTGCAGGPPSYDAEGGTGPWASPAPAESQAGEFGVELFEVQTFYEKMFLEQGYRITYLRFRIDRDGEYVHPEFDEKYWREQEGPRRSFGHAPTKKTDLND